MGPPTYHAGTTFSWAEERRTRYLRREGIFCMSDALSQCVEAALAAAVSKLDTSKLKKVEVIVTKPHGVPAGCVTDGKGRVFLGGSGEPTLRHQDPKGAAAFQLTR